MDMAEVEAVLRSVLRDFEEDKEYEDEDVTGAAECLPLEGVVVIRWREHRDVKGRWLGGTLDVDTSDYSIDLPELLSKLLQDLQQMKN
jgi:hypothetical protein